MDDVTIQDRQGVAAPIWTLLLLSPFIAELLSGATRTSILFVYVPEVMVWGVGALLCRELVRRWHPGGMSRLMRRLRQRPCFAGYHGAVSCRWPLPAR